MDKLTLRLTKNMSYKKDPTTIGFEILAGFLLYDVNMYGSKAWKEFIDHSDKTFDFGNYCYLEKDGYSVTIGFEDRYNIVNAKETLKITKKQLSYIIDRWQEALEKKPSKIIITKDDNGEIKVEFED